MKITDFYWRRYKIPFKRSFANRYEEIKYRKGLLLFIETDDGLRGVGDIAPLQGFGGQVDDYIPHLVALRPRLLNSKIQRWMNIIGNYYFLGKREFPTIPMPLWGGIKLIEETLQAERDGLSLAQWLTTTPWRTASPLRTSIAVNYSVGVQDTAQAVEQCVTAVAAGYSCIKIKVGFSTNVEAEHQRVAAIRAAVGPEIELRLDANGAWDEATALQMMAAVAPHNIALLEQPIPPTPGNHRDIESMVRLQSHRLPIKLAADESVDGFQRIGYMVWRKAVDALVLKPALLGGPEETLFNVTSNLGISPCPDIIVTSMLDTAIGIAGALQVAAAIPHNLLACGLATADLLEATLIKESLTPVNGMLAVPQGPGLGVTLDEAQVEQYCGPEERGE